MVTDELVNLRRAVYSRPGFVRAIRNTLVLQDPEVRKDYAWDPAWVGRITAPTLLLWTEHDPTGGLDEADLLLHWLPDARLHVIADAGHWPQWEKTDEYLRAHRDFLLLGKDPA
jgi:2-hydroxy-6-oxonona-2,4-dienedioate hydrolase